MEDNHKEQVEQLEFIQNFAKMISSTFIKFAELCRNQINVNKNNTTSVSSVKPPIHLQRNTQPAPKMSQTSKNISQSLDAGSKPEIRKPHNALSLFISDERQKILRQNSALDFMQVTQRASAKWKNMSDQQKKPYLQKYEILKSNYEKEKDNFDPDEDAQNSKKTIKEAKVAQKNQLIQAQNQNQRLSESKQNELDNENEKVVSSSNQNEGIKKVSIVQDTENSDRQFEESKIQERDQYEEIAFSQQKEKTVEVIQISQTQNQG